ncbi:MAG: cytochrome c oxidase subunit 3, partial [Gemmatimonadaceae bacterium]
WGLVVFIVVPGWDVVRAALALDPDRARIALIVASVLKLGILGLRWYEVKALNTRWNSDAYGSAAWFVLGFHATLLLLDFMEDLGIVILLSTHRENLKHCSDVADDAMYWYFTVAAWIPLFVLVFLYPRWT